MKAISLWQPWASLIVDGRKQYETRDWATKHRGPLAIHAAKVVDKDACRLFGYRPYDIPSGAVLGVADLMHCCEMTEEIIAMQGGVELAVGHWMVGRFAWKLRLVERFIVPVPTVGRQGIFEWPR